MNYPYQLVVFFDREPMLGEFVYQGSSGWFPQVALKRRFRFVGLSEDQGLTKVQEYLQDQPPFQIAFGDRLQPPHMPVRVIEVAPAGSVKLFHQGLIRSMRDAIESKYPDRENDNYYPHMTVTWNGKVVVEEGTFENSGRPVTHIWILKDEGEKGDSKVYRKYSLGE